MCIRPILSDYLTSFITPITLLELNDEMLELIDVDDEMPELIDVDDEMSELIDVDDKMSELIDIDFLDFINHNEIHNLIDQETIELLYNNFDYIQP